MSSLSSWFSSSPSSSSNGKEKGESLRYKLSQNAQHMGVIFKYGGFFPHWQEKFAIIYGQHLYMFPIDEEERPSDKVPLAGASTQRTEKPAQSRPFAFELHDPGQVYRTYFLSAPSEDSLGRWIECLGEAIRVSTAAKRSRKYSPAADVSISRPGASGSGSSPASAPAPAAPSAPTPASAVGAVPEEEQLALAWFPPLAIWHLRARGKHERGLFLRPGSLSEAWRLDRALEQATGRESINLHAYSPSAIGYVLRTFLSGLPAIIPHSLHGAFAVMPPTEEEREQRLKEVISVHLPSANHVLFEQIVRMLHEVLECADENGLTAEVLGATFAASVAPVTDRRRLLPEIAANLAFVLERFSRFFSEELQQIGGRAPPRAAPSPRIPRRSDLAEGEDSFKRKSQGFTSALAVDDFELIHFAPSPPTGRGPARAQSDAEEVGPRGSSGRGRSTSLLGEDNEAIESASSNCAHRRRTSSLQLGE